MAEASSQVDNCSPVPEPSLQEDQVKPKEEATAKVEKNQSSEEGSAYGDIRALLATTGGGDLAGELKDRVG